MCAYDAGCALMIDRVAANLSGLLLYRNRLAPKDAGLQVMQKSVLNQLI
jgi:hypothetical protein